MNRKAVQIGDFRGHINTISETDVHISSPGTAQMYQTFLPDGAVHINMGDGDGSYMEEYMAEGSPYLRALYYPRRLKKSGLFELTNMQELLRRARELLNKGFTKPVPINENLSPIGRVYKALAYWKHEHKVSREVLAN